MRKFWVFGLTSALLLVSLALPPLSGAAPQAGKRVAAGAAKKKQASKAAASAETYRAVNFGVSRTVRELAAAQPTLSKEQAALEGIKSKKDLIERRLAFNTGGSKAARRVEAEQQVREKNLSNKKIIRKADPNAPGSPDAAIADLPSGKGGLAPQVMPAPGVSFEAISLTDTTALPNQGFLPPDTVGEIGPNHYVQMVNSAFRVYSRAGVPLIPLTSIGALFSTLPGPCAGSEDGDPVVLYDQLADRWILSEFCVSVANPNNHQLIAVSQTGDPTGAYYLYDFMMPNNKFNDYPHLGVWSNAYLMTDNQFNQAGTQFLGAGVFAFNRAKMLAGDPAANFVYFDKAEGCPFDCQFGGMLPTDIDGFAVAAFDPREVPSGSRNVVPQPSPGVSLDAISDRLMFRLAYRNYGTHESIAAVHTVNAAVNPAFRAGVRYYELRKTGGSAWAVQEQGTMAGTPGDTVHRWMGSTAMNGSGSQAVGYSASSASVFPSIRYAGRAAGDPAGSLAQGEATLVAGTGAQTHSSGRWGDYSDLTVDPLDDCTFWYTTEYVTGASAPDNQRWHTRVGSFQFGPCAPAQKGVLDGTVTSSQGGAPVPNATLSAGPFVRTSGAGGAYNIDPVGTGTYTLTVSAPGFATATVPGVVIAQGATTTRNVQLAPLNLLAGGTPSVTAESVAPSNNAPDPGETITINLPVVNNGGAGATTSNLVATLQAAGGVAAPSGPQNYGAVAQGSAAVVRPFTFTVNASCGQFLDITLQLQDGASNLGNIVYRVRTGTLGAGVIESYSTGNIATPIPDAGQVEIPIVVGATGAVGDVNARVRLNHTYDEDLTLTLISPAGTEVVLSASRDTAAGGGDNYGTGANDCSGTPTVFDDAAATAISAGVPPFAGTFRPESPLAAFNGESVGGTWKLRVSDNASIDTGTVGCVTLQITRQPFACNTQSCSLSCPANVFVPADGGGTSAVVNYPAAGVTGACGVPSYSTPSGSTFPVGTTQVTVTGAGGATCNFNVTVVPPGGGSNLIISEFRLRGPNGANDEYVELYNRGDSPLTVSVADGSAGWAVAASDGVIRFVVPAGTVIPARGHYLGVNNTASGGYSLAAYPAGGDMTATGDAAWATDIPDNSGLALFKTSTPANLVLANRLDAVGFSTSPGLYAEGTGLPTLAPSNLDHVLYRNLTGGAPQDTGNNAADFLFADTDATPTGVGQRLGAPGPENLSSPVNRNATIKAGLIDPSKLSSESPNRVRVLTSDPANNSAAGTLEIRRKFTNNTGAPVSRLRFRIVDITTSPAPAGTADLRARTSSNLSVTITGGSTVQLRGTTLEQPAPQAKGGGFNSTLSANIVSLATPLAAGASVNVRLLLGVQQSGNFRFLINVEALP
ncbi:MAG: carboxypeptidase regulatory-like domain-containing protein [Acidobacteria bacterium]|nr:carboxypeptidase regulatory-like domain-containing protein [Acidobacteriota bacterium]